VILTFGVAIPVHRFPAFLCLLASFFAITGCGGSSSSSPAPSSLTTATATLAAGGATTFYVVAPSSTLGAGTLQAYSLSTLSGTATPQSTLSVPANFAPSAVTLDPNNGTIYVGGTYFTGSNFTGCEILAYPAGATGSSAPQRTITFGQFYGCNVEVMRVDSNGNLFAATPLYTNAIYEFSPTANGNATPLRSIASNQYNTNYSITSKNGLVIDGSGNIFLSLYASCGNAICGAVVELGPNVTDIAQPTAQYISASGVYLSGLALDSNSNLYTVQNPYAQTGSAAILKLPITNGSLSRTPTTVMTWSSTSASLLGLLRDNAGNFYATSVDDTAMRNTLSPTPTGIVGFGPNGSGTVTPGLLVASSTLAANLESGYAIK